MIYSEFLTIACKLTSAKLDCRSFLERVRAKTTDFTRTRKMNFQKLMSFMLGYYKESCSLALQRFFEQNDEDMTMAQQSFSEARQKILPEAFIELFEDVAQIPYPLSFRTHFGMRVLAIDGTSIALPSDETLKNHYGCSGAGSKSPTARASVLHDVLNDLSLHAYIKPYYVGERALAHDLLDRHTPLADTKDVVLFDRGYASVELIRKLQSKQLHFIMRVKRKFNLDIDQFGGVDGRITLADEDGSIEVRVLKFPLPSGETEVLITDIFDNALGVEHFRQFYALRWGIESEYDVLKNKLQVENFTGRTVRAIEQDFYISMYLSNMMALAKLTADSEIEVRNATKGLKYAYKSNKNHIIGTLKDKLIRVVLENDPVKQQRLLGKIYEQISQVVVPCRPNRSVPRPANPRKAKYHHNQKSAL